jgi:hypothetical protein
MHLHQAVQELETLQLKDNHSMKILSGYIDWMTHSHNHPYIYVTVDKFPKQEEFVYEKRDGIYFAELDGAVSFFFYVEPGRGFGGHHFPVNMKDGTKEVLIGPWSSGSYAANQLGFTPSVEVTIIEGKHSHIAGNATVALVQEAMDKGIIELRDYLAHEKVNNPRYRFSKKFPAGSKLSLMHMISSSGPTYCPVVLLSDGSVFEKFSFLKATEEEGYEQAEGNDQKGI